MLRVCLLAFGVVVLPAAALAHDYDHGDLTISHPWSRPTPPGTPVGVGYMDITNRGDSPVILVAGETAAAEAVSIHETVSEDGLMKMRPLREGLTVPAGETVSLKPHSYHLMLEPLKAPLKEGDEVPLLLEFEGMEPVEVTLHVQQPDASSNMDHATGRHDH